MAVEGEELEDITCLSRASRSFIVMALDPFEAATIMGDDSDLGKYLDFNEIFLA